MMFLRKTQFDDRVRRRDRSVARLLYVEHLECRRLLAASKGLQTAELGALAVDTSSYHPSRVLVRYSEQGPAAAASFRRSDNSSDLVPGLREVLIDPAVGVQTTLKALKSDPNVIYAEPDFRVSLDVLPNDPQMNLLWGLHNTGQTGGTDDADIDAAEAWDVTDGSGNTIVAVIDTGVDYTHPDLAGNIWTNSDEIPGNNIDDDGNGYVDDIHGYDFVNRDGNPLDDHFHGTHVAGTIGAIGNNGIGVAGVNWNVQIMALKFLDAGGGGYISDALAALNYAVANGAAISNNSWGGGGFSQAFQDALQSAANAGHIFVAAAGNDSSNNDTFPAYPASYDVPNVVSVAATNHLDSLAYFSNYGSTSVDLGAPGESIRSTFPSYSTDAIQFGGFSINYDTISGTSMATPHVAGVMALVRDQHPTWSYSQVIDQVLGTVDIVPGLQQTVTQGRLNAAAAVGNPVPDQSGPRITSSTPSGAVSGAVTNVRFTFNESIDASSFTQADVFSFTGPGGIDLRSEITGVSGSGRTFTVSFNSQSAIGSYQIVVGPDIYDQSLPPNAMDQDRDGILGEVPDDRYTGSFNISEVLVFPSPDVPAPIYDFTATVSYLTIDQDVMIRDLNVQLNITHTYDGDLQFYLISPNDPYNYVLLSEFRGGAGQNFTDTMFDDEASVPIGQGSAPFNGSYQPETPLSAFEGQNARGTWELWIEDWGFFDEGTLNSWSLWIQPGDIPPPPQPENQPPDAVDDFAQTDEDTSVTLTAAALLQNDSDPDGDPIVIDSVSGPLHGTVVLNPDSTITFTPDLNFNYYSDTAGFTYTILDPQGASDSAFVWIDVVPVNDPPAANDDSVAAAKNQVVTFNDGIGLYLEANDTDVDGDYLYVSAAFNAQNGTVVMDGNGIIQFTPDVDFVGTASFEYTVTDGLESDTGLVQIQFKEVFYLSTTTNGSITGSDNSTLTFSNADILQLGVDSTGEYSYSIYFDGSDVGLSAGSEDIDAFTFLTDGSILISTFGSFSVPRPSGGSYSGAGEDLLQFWPSSLGETTSGYWDFYFDGSNVGLSGSAENIDAVAQLQDGRILVSTAGSYSVPGIPSSTGTDADEDLLAFTPSTLGRNTTSGTWAHYFDGSDVGLSTNSGEDIDGLFVRESSSGGLPELHFSTRGNFAVAGLTGANEDAFAFHPTRLGGTTVGTFGPGLSLDGSLYGLASFDIDGMYLQLPPSASPIGLVPIIVEQPILSDLATHTLPSFRTVAAVDSIFAKLAEPITRVVRASVTKSVQAPVGGAIFLTSSAIPSPHHSEKVEFYDPDRLTQIDEFFALLGNVFASRLARRA